MCTVNSSGKGGVPGAMPGGEGCVRMQDHTLEDYVNMLAKVSWD